MAYPEVDLRTVYTQMISSLPRHSMMSFLSPGLVVAWTLLLITFSFTTAHHFSNAWKIFHHLATANPRSSTPLHLTKSQCSFTIVAPSRALTNNTSPRPLPPFAPNHIISTVALPSIRLWKKKSSLSAFPKLHWNPKTLTWIYLSIYIHQECRISLPNKIELLFSILHLWFPKYTPCMPSFERRIDCISLGFIVKQWEHTKGSSITSKRNMYVLVV